MKKSKIELDIDPEKLRATRQFMAIKGLDMEAKLSYAAMRFYSKYVPSDVRKYIEGCASTTHAARSESSISASVSVSASSTGGPDAETNSEVSSSSLPE